MKLIATKKGYVRRLRQMLTHKDECGCCPLQYGYKLWAGNKYQCCDINTNIWCRDFIGLPTVNAPRTCPCYSYEINNPIELAHAAIARWDRGTHKWQKEAK